MKSLKIPNNDNLVIQIIEEMSTHYLNITIYSLIVSNGLIHSHVHLKTRGPMHICI